MSGFTPTIGPAGTAVTITGTNFEPIKTNNKVKFNVTKAGVSSASPTSIVSNAPTGTSGRLSVTTPFGSTTSTGDFFLTPSPYVAADVVVTSRMTFGENRTVAIPTANKVGMVIFDGAAGERVSLKISSVTLSNSNVTIYKPDGTTLVSTPVTTAGTFIEPQTLPLSGTYTILVDPTGTATGSMLINLYNVPADITGPIVAGGSSVPLSLGTPGQNANITFTGTAGQKVSLSLTSLSITQVLVYVKNPDGSTLASRQMAGVYGNDMIDTLVLPANGTYSILVNPTTSYTGGITLTLNDTTDINGTIVAGTPVAQSITTPGKNAYFSFNGNAGQRVSLNLTGASYTTTYSQGMSYPGAHVSILNPDGSTLTSLTLTTANGLIDAVTLPAAGTFKILLDPRHANTGSVTLTLYEVSDITGSIVIGGSSVPLSLGTPGQNANITFTGTAGQKVSLSLTSLSITQLWVYVKNPDGSTLASRQMAGVYGNDMIGTLVLPANGTYSILLNPTGSYTGNITLTLNDNTDIEGTIAANGTPIVQSINTPGTNAYLSFTGTAGQRVALHITGISYTQTYSQGSSTAGGNISIIKPDSS
ncbi:MAG: pre-peptidase C-terminal domain-containing protein, partial [Pyrinomonadaceae bacterium]